MRKLVIHRPILGLVMAGAFATGTAAPALAAHEPPRVGLTVIGQDGIYFELTLEPGEAADLQVEVGNFGHSELVARTFAADAYSLINGGFGAELFGEAASGTTRWLDYPTEELTLGSNEGLTIDFTVAVPAGTAPGEYIAALVAENAEPYAGPDQSGLAVEQVNRTAVAVAIQVPGPDDPSLQIGAVGHKVAADTSFVSFEVTNPGNVHLKPAGEFTLRNDSGAQVAAAPARMDSVYAGTETLFEAPLAEVLEPGDYCAELSLTDEKTGASDASDCLPFSVEPPLAQAPASGRGSTTVPVLQPAIDALAGNPILGLLVAALLLGAVAAIGVLWRRRRRARDEFARVRARIGPETPEWPAADDLSAPARADAPRGPETVLRAVLADLPQVSRAWLGGGPGERRLIVEFERGTDAAVGARIARSLQAEMQAGGPELDIPTRFVQGPGPVARATRGAKAFYVSPRVVREKDAMRPEPG